jgi:competence protein ComEA
MKGVKYVLAGLAVVAAITALVVRPPHGDAVPTAPSGGVPTSDVADAARAGSPLRGRFSAHASRQAKVVVYVAGEVVKPGVYSLAAGSRAQDALLRAGGAKADADLVAVNLAAPLEDGTEIAVPQIGAAPAGRARAPRGRSAHARRGSGGRSSRGGHRRGRSDAAAPLPQSIDLNAADVDELEALPGIGPTLAARIIAYRETNGPFASVDELADIAGITPGLQEKIADFVVVR